MRLPPAVRDDALRQIAQFCERRLAAEVLDEVRLEHTIRGNAITIIERRPPWSKLIGPDWTSMKIAQLRYDERTRAWTLFAADRNER